MSSAKTSSRINNVCMNVILRYPFFGYLLLHMDIKETNDENAYTDMKSIYLNYRFIESLSDYELEFVILHELLHAALKHPINAEGHDHIIYGLAADIMVNTIILDSMKTYRMQLVGQTITKSIFGNEVYKMGTEKIYQTLMNDRSSKYVKDMLGSKSTDNHRNWGAKVLTGNKEYINGLWDEYIKGAIAFEGERKGSGVGGIGSLFSDFSSRRSRHISNTEWKELLRDFLTVSNEKYDYSFAPPDRRYSFLDVFLPEYNLIEDKKIGKLWFCVDTSMSMRRSDVEALFIEIEKCIKELGYLDGLLSFFDESTTDPVSFHTVNDICAIRPSGGRGTDFECIFDYMRENMMNQPPGVVIVMTDGYAPFPMEMMACGIPVLWAIIGDNPVVPPWGKAIYLGSAS